MGHGQYTPGGPCVQIHYFKCIVQAYTTDFKDKMEDIKRDLGELIKEFKVFFSNKDIMQHGYDKKLHNDWHIMTFALYLQLLLKGAHGGDEVYQLLVTVPGEAVEAIQALFQRTDAQDQDMEIEDPEGDEGIADVDVELLEGAFSIKLDLNWMCQFTKLGLERIRSRRL